MTDTAYVVFAVYNLKAPEYRTASERVEVDADNWRRGAEDQVCHRIKHAMMENSPTMDGAIGYATFRGVFCFFGMGLITSEEGQYLRSLWSNSVERFQRPV